MGAPNDVFNFAFKRRGGSLINWCLDSCHCEGDTVAVKGVIDYWQAHRTSKTDLLDSDLSYGTNSLVMEDSHTL